MAYTYFNLNWHFNTFLLSFLVSFVREKRKKKKLSFGFPDSHKYFIYFSGLTWCIKLISPLGLSAIYLPSSLINNIFLCIDPSRGLREGPWMRISETCHLAVSSISWTLDMEVGSDSSKHNFAAHLQCCTSRGAGEIWHWLPESHPERWTIQVLSSSQHGGYFCFRLISVLFLSLVILIVTWYSCLLTGQGCASGLTQVDPPYLRPWLFLSLMLQKIKEAREMGFIYGSDKHTNWTLP